MAITIRLFKVFLIIFVVFSSLTLIFTIGNYFYCYKVSCEEYPPKVSPAMLTSFVISQYETAIQDINLGRYEAAKQRLEYILSKNPEYPGAKEKLIEVENFLKVTPMP